MDNVLTFARPAPVAPAVDPNAQAIGYCDDALAEAKGRLIRILIIGVDVDGNEYRSSTNDDATDLHDMAATAITILEGQANG